MSLALTITEIYASIQGESSFAGQPCTFVRLTACDLRCAWCDTVYAFTEGRKQSLDDILAEVRQLGVPLVELTGGEPLLQKNVIPLMQRLIDEGYTVLLETGGHVSIADVPAARPPHRRREMSRQRRVRPHALGQPRPADAAR